MGKQNVAILFLFAASLTFGQKTDARLIGVDTEIENLLKAYHAVGLSVAVVENNKTIYSRGFGYRDLERKLPATPNTIFPIGSITKSFTASLLGMLENQRLLSIKERPSFYIPKLQFYNDRMDNLITIEDLLCHKSGIGRADGTYVFFPADKRENLVPRFKYLKPGGAIKDGWIYSNLGYVLAGTVVEKVTNESWEKNIHDRIFLPLKMNSSSTSVAEMTKSSDYSLGYGISDHQSHQVLFSELHNDKPSGAINSTSLDMINWVAMWLNNGDFEGKEILDKGYIQDATSMKAIDNGLPPDTTDPNVYTFGYGYGWKVSSYKGHYKVHHGGNVSGFSSQLVMYPTDHLGIVVLSNQHNSILPYIVADVLTNRLLNFKRTEWQKYPVKVDEIYTISTSIKGINKDKMPTHSLDDYCGKFRNQGFGTFEIVKEENELFAVFQDYKFRVEHQYYDIFVLKPTKEIPQIMNPGFFLNFSLDNEGNVFGVKINLQEEPVEFIKQSGE
ncbi:MAG: serine hydrolase [Chitinophagales bacterium]